MIIIGLTGSIAMGKSEVARIFQEQGIPVFDADAEVHALYDSKKGAELLSEIVPEATRNQRVDREVLRVAIQNDSSLLPQIEKRVHAHVNDVRVTFLETARKNGAEIVVLDVPLLFETQGDKHVDRTVVVSSPPELQRRRALARPGMTESQLDLILSRQMPDHEKRKRATHILENSGTLKDLRVRTLELITQLKRSKVDHARNHS